MPNAIKLKVCGLRNNITEVDALNPDYVGFIFFPKSPRYVGTLFVKPNNLRGHAVGVFVNQPVDEVLELSAKYKLDYIQLHGDESVDYCVEIKALSRKIIKVFAGNKPLDQNILDDYAPFIDYYLFDTKLEQHGGTGVSFNWDVLHNLKLKKPYFISGGVGLDNIDDLLKSGLQPYALDVNSKFEVEPGLKDIERLKELKELIKN